LKHQCRKHEEPKNHNLQYKPGKHNALATIDATRGVGRSQDDSTHSLNQEAKNVAANKNLGKPSGTDHRVFSVASRSNDAAEEHVDGRGEKDWSKEDHECLENVDRLGVCVRVCVGSSGISNGFNCEYK
jgi:hypothetical protein